MVGGSLSCVCPGPPIPPPPISPSEARHNLTLNWAVSPTPQVPNDNFAARATLAWPSSTATALSVDGSTAGASLELNDQGDDYYFVTSNAPTVYYKITAGATGADALPWELGCNLSVWGAKA